MRRRRSAIYVKHVMFTAVGVKPGGENPPIFGSTVTLRRLENDCPGAVPEQDACAAVGPIENSRKGLGADHKRRIRLAHTQEIVGHRHGIDKAATNRLDRRMRTPGSCRVGLGRASPSRETFHRALRSPKTIMSSSPTATPASMSASVDACMARSDVFLAIGCDVPPLDPRASRDPFVTGVDDLRHLVVGHHPGRKI